MATEEELIDSLAGIAGYLQGTVNLPGIRVRRIGSKGVAMAVEITGQVGPQIRNNGDQGVAFRQGRFGESVVSEYNGRYANMVQDGIVYSACNPASQATSAALATAYTGCCVTNPPGSGKNLVILRAGFSSVSAPSGIINVGLMGGAGAVTHTAALIIHSNVVGAMTVSPPAAVALADSSATIPTPVLLMPLQNATTSGALSTAATAASDDIGGLFTVPPGSFIAIYTFTAAAGEAFISWAETAT